MHLIVAPQLSGGWRHNYSTKTRPAGCTNEQSMYSLMSMLYFKENKAVHNDSLTLWQNSAKLVGFKEQKN